MYCVLVCLRVCLLGGVFVWLFSCFFVEFLRFSFLQDLMIDWFSIDVLIDVLRACLFACLCACLCVCLFVCLFV